MATRKTREAPADNEDDGSENLGLPEESESELGALLADLAGSSNSSITVYRANKNERPKFLFKCDPGAFSLEMLRDDYNGGDFRVYITRNGTLYKNLPVSVEAPQRGKQEPFAPAQADIVLALKAGFDQQAQMLRDTLMTMRQPATPPVDLAALMQAMAGMMATLRGAVVPDPVPQAVAPASDGKFIDVLLKGVELGKSFVPGADEGGLLGVMKDLLKGPLVEEALKAVSARAATPAPAPAPVQRPALVRQQAVQAPQPSTPAPSPQPTGENAMMTRYVSQLVHWASSEADPDVYAILIVDNVPEATLRTLIDHPDAVDRLAAINPEVNAYRPWFEELKERILDHLTEPPQLVPTPGGLTQGGVSANNVSDVPGHSPQDVPRNAA